jgi:hypothetical protein
MRRPQLNFRTLSNTALDRSGGRMFCNLIGPGEGGVKSRRPVKSDVGRRLRSNDKWIKKNYTSKEMSEARSNIADRRAFVYEYSYF